MKKFVQIVVATSVWISLQAFALTSERISELESIHQSISNKQVPLLQGQPLTIRSNTSDKQLRAEIFAVHQYSFSELVNKLSVPKQWCQFITLHLNIKACVYRTLPHQSLSFFAGRKFYEPAEDAFELEYRFEIKTVTNNYFKLNLSAEEGPFGTQDYLIELELLKVKNEVLIHMALSYQTSFSSRLGTSVYLKTIGADKIGFSQIKNSDDEFEYIQGIEGIIERNVMRYYLALSTYLRSDSRQQMTKAWFNATELFAKQLHEVELADYLDAKQLEYQQQSLMQQRINRGLSLFEDIVDDN